MANDVRSRSSVTPRGSRTAFVPASATRKIFSPSGASSCPTRRFGNGVAPFGPAYARTLRRRLGPMGDTRSLDELFGNLQGRQHYLWRAVDQDGDVIDIRLQPRRDRQAAVRFFRKLSKEKVERHAV